MKVELVSKTVGQGRYEGLTNEEIVAAVARHGKIKEDNGRLVRYLMDHKHWSPLQHISYTFRVETSRFIGAQILRHRSLHFQELSQRYEETLDFEPLNLRKQAKTNRQSSEGFVGRITQDPFNKGVLLHINVDMGKATDEQVEAMRKMAKAVEISYDAYKSAVDAGIAKECARGILPMSTKTVMHISGTLRDLLAFLNIRLDEHAQEEIRHVAQKIGEDLAKDLPEVFNKIDWKNGMFM